MEQKKVYIYIYNAEAHRNPLVCIVKGSCHCDGNALLL